MPKYEVSVLRVSHQWATHTLDAASEAEARATTLDLAGDFDFQEKSCEYSIEEVDDLEPKWNVSITSAAQTLVVDEATGRTVAVVYDAANAETVARAPAIEALCKAWLADETDDGTFADALRKHFAN